VTFNKSEFVSVNVIVIVSVIVSVSVWVCVCVSSLNSLSWELFAIINCKAQVT